MLGSAPSLVLALGCLALAGLRPAPALTLTALAALCLAFAGRAAVRVAESPLRVAATIAASLREGDVSVRARSSGRGDAADLLLSDLNSLADTLREGRLSSLEAAALVRKITEAVPSALCAFDEAGTLVLANAAAERLLGLPRERLVGEKASSLGLAALLDDTAPHRVDGPIGGRPGPWELASLSLRQHGRPVRLLVVSSIARLVHDEERQAQRALVRVLGHEINNSLGPIHSLADSLLSVVRAQPAPDADLDEGLAIIARRAGSLRRFLEAYQRLSRLPPPTLAECDLSALLARVARLEARLPIALELAPGLRLLADETQLEQALVNLVKNAVEAAIEAGGGVTLRLEAQADRAAISVLDEGPGLGGTASLFVPFFTTKPQGSGIGLCLSREIAWAHGGTLLLEDRPDRPGCVATLTLPLLRPPREAPG